MRLVYVTVSAERPSVWRWSRSSKAVLSCFALPHASIAELNETIEGRAPAAFISESTVRASLHCLFFLYQRIRAL